MTSELFTIGELIENRLSSANLSNDEGKCDEVIPSSFKDEMDSIKNFKFILFV